MSRKKRHRSNFVYKRRRADMITVLLRLGFLLLIITVIAGFVYMHPEGYEDSKDGDVSPVDAVYFTVISITTTGYGDIVPVSSSARILDTVLITIGRAAMWFVIVGTTYQFIYDRYREAAMMKTIQAVSLM